MAAIIFGSSKDLLRPFWRVWTFEQENACVMPLAHFNDKNKSDTAAFDLAHSAASFEDPSALDGILASSTSAPTPLSPKLTELFSKLAKDAIQMSETPQPGKSAVTVRKTPDDTVYVVRFPTDAK